MLVARPGQPCSGKLNPKPSVLHENRLPSLLVDACVTRGGKMQMRIESLLGLHLGIAMSVYSSA